MKIFRLIASLSLTLSLFLFLNFKQGDLPAMGKFLNPFRGFWTNGESKALNIEDFQSIDALQDEVTIKFDEQIIPHVFANNDHDLYFVQGYLHAYHRLWQMEFQAHAAAGRLSEILGAGENDKFIHYDKKQRRKGIVRAAQESMAAMDKDAEKTLAVKSYTKGINYFIDNLSAKNIPVEYKLLDYSPEPWTMLKSFLLLKNMADILSSSEADLENTNALELFGREEFDVLFPDRFPDMQPVVDKRKWNFNPVEINKPDVEFPVRRTTSVMEKSDGQLGSNNFAVSGDKTANGKVLLANEPDLELLMPSIWYVNQLQSPTMNVMGASLVGIPGVIIGFNDSIAWGMTNAKQDVVDWYAISFKDDHKTEYQYDNKWMKTEKVLERIKVRGGDTVEDTVIYTHYGPITYDDRFISANDKVNLSMRWTAHLETEEMHAIYLLNRASDYESFKFAASHYACPAQNFVFANTKGDIGLTIVGQFPAKWEEQGKFLMDGSDSRHEWQQFIPFDHLPFEFNPKRGFVSSANQFPVDNLYPYYVYDHHYEFYRNRRINDRLGLMTDITPEDLSKLQHDNYNYSASESLPFMLMNLDTMNFSQEDFEYFDLIRKWDYFNDPKREAPIFYQIWWDIFYEKIWDEFDEQGLALIKPHVYSSIHLMKNDPNNRFFDTEGTELVESAYDLFSDAFAAAADSMQVLKQNPEERLKWSEYKNTTISHMLRLEPFSRGNVDIGGYKSIINAASATHGPSWRMVVELGDDKVSAWGIYPGSQSGNPGNVSYGHMIDDWASGVYYQLNFLKTVDEENDNIVYTTTIEP